jgi:hypothetical protein
VVEGGNAEARTPDIWAERRDPNSTSAPAANNKTKAAPITRPHGKLLPAIFPGKLPPGNPSHDNRLPDNARPFPITLFLRCIPIINGVSRRRASFYHRAGEPPAADMSFRNWRKINNYLNI